LPTIVLGDFNEWFPWARGRRRLLERFSAIPLPKTFPTRFPLFALDHVWTCPGRSLESLSAVKTPLTRVASDHFPVLAIVSQFEGQWDEAFAAPRDVGRAGRAGLRRACSG
jgi:endonuclease/exonuclease/phosphatase family metal-dependent hydrolase